VGRDPVVDPQVWTLSERARESAIAGDTERARELADEAVERAKGLDDRELSPHLAEAWAATGEVLARAGDFQGAHDKFIEAERHAIAAEYARRLLDMRLLWAKVDARREAPDRGSDHLRRAEALGHALQQAESPTHIAELEEAMGIVARAKGDHEAAIGHHRKAYELFTELERPLLAARALMGVGASSSSALPRAREAYEDALRLYREIGVPQRYRNRVTAHMNLGLIALIQNRGVGLRHFRYVVDYGEPDERLKALASGTNLAVNDQRREEARDWAKLIDQELTSRRDAPQALAQKAQLAAAVARFGLLRTADGEVHMQTALEMAKDVSPRAQATTLQQWVEWLEHHGACVPAAQRLAESDKLAEGVGSSEQYSRWREVRPGGRCKKQG